MVVERVARITVADLDRLELTCKNCGHGIVIPLRAKPAEAVPEYVVGGQIVCGHCKKHWWCPPTSAGEPAINSHLPPLIRALIDAASEEEIGVRLTMVSVQD